MRWLAGPGTALAVLERAETVLAVSAWVTVGIDGGRRGRARAFGRLLRRRTA